MTRADAPRLTEVFEEHADEMVSRARRVLGSEAEAEDAVQEVMLTLLDAPDVLTTVHNIGGWLYTLVRRKAIDLVRSDSRRRRRETTEGIAELFQDADDPDELMERDEVAAAVADAVDALPAPMREAFVGNVLDGQTFREMSERTGVPMGTLMARKKTAVDRIRAQLRRRELLG